MSPPQRSPTQKPGGHRGRTPPGPPTGGQGGAPSVLLSVSSRTLYSRTFSLWCWNSRRSLSSSSLENFPEVFAWEERISCQPAHAPG